MNSITDILNSQNELYNSQKVPGFVQGKVVENNKSEFKGMVKVEFTVWEEGENYCNWLRVLTPYGGGAYGSYVLPEIEDIVLVGFIGGNLQCPFVIGSLYPSGAGMVENSFDEKNEKKRLVTKGETEITILETAGKQSITVQTKKGAKFVIEDENETCTISDKSAGNSIKLDYKKGEISITAAKKITLKAGSAKLELDGNTGDIKGSATNFKVNANADVALEATANAKIKGTLTTIEGSGKLDIKCSAITNISGAMVKIN